MSLEQVSKPCKGYLNLEQETKSTMTKESGRKTVLLHSDSSDSEKRNQLAFNRKPTFRRSSSVDTGSIPSLGIKVLLGNFYKHLFKNFDILIQVLIEPT